MPPLPGIAIMREKAILSMVVYAEILSLLPLQLLLLLLQLLHIVTVVTRVIALLTRSQDQ